jgi:hypothetical protein
MYTVMLCNPFGDTPYRPYLGTLSLIGIRSQGKFKAGKATGLTREAGVLPFEDGLRCIVAWGSHYAPAGMRSRTT